MGSVIDRIVPQRYWAWAATAFLAAACLAAAAWSPLWLWPGIAFACLALAGRLDYAQPGHGELLASVPAHPVYQVFWPDARPDTFAAPQSVLTIQTGKTR